MYTHDPDNRCRLRNAGRRRTPLVVYVVLGSGTPNLHSSPFCNAAARYASQAQLSGEPWRITARPTFPLVVAGRDMLPQIDLGTRKRGHTDPMNHWLCVGSLLRGHIVRSANMRSEVVTGFFSSCEILIIAYPGYSRSPSLSL